MGVPLITTLSAIHKQRLGHAEWMALLMYLGKTKADKEPLPFETILDSNGLEAALSYCRTAPQYARQWRLLAVSYASDVAHLVKGVDVEACTRVAQRHAVGDATNEELAEARSAAWLARSAMEAALVAASPNAALAVLWAAKAAAHCADLGEVQTSRARLVFRGELFGD